MRRIKMLKLRSKRSAAVALAGAAAVAGGGALAATLATSDPAPAAELRFVEAGVIGVSPSTREAELVVRCGSDLEGKILTVKVARQVDAKTLTPGTTLGAVIATPKNELLKVTPSSAVCDSDDSRAADALLQPGADAALDTQAASSSKVSAVPAADEQAPARQPSLSRAFGSRSWSFHGETSYDDGVLELDVDRIPNLPLRFASEARTVMDEHVRLVLGASNRVVDPNGRSIARSALDDATVRVTGSLLPRASWTFDGDGEITPAIRAARVLVLRIDWDD